MRYINFYVDSTTHQSKHHCIQGKAGRGVESIAYKTNNYIDCITTSNYVNVIIHYVYNVFGCR